MIRAQLISVKSGERLCEVSLEGHETRIVGTGDPLLLARLHLLFSQPRVIKHLNVEGGLELLTLEPNHPLHFTSCLEALDQEGDVRVELEEVDLDR